VQGGTIKVDAKGLPEGATVTVLAPEGDETFELLPQDEAKLLAAIGEAERGETTSALQVRNSSADRDPSVSRPHRQQRSASHRRSQRMVSGESEA
jgi:hypothetical protein